MLQRCGYWSLLAITLTMSSGCMFDVVSDLHDNFVAHYQATHWMGPQCGQTYWSEWFNDPPDCCEPCNQCGYYQEPQGCVRSYLSQRRHAFFNSLFGRQDCCCGDYVLGPHGCEPLHACASSGCGRGCQAGAGMGPQGLPDELDDGGEYDGQVIEGGEPMQGGKVIEGEQPMEGGRPMEAVPPPPPTPPTKNTPQSKRSRLLRPAGYYDPYQDVFDDNAPRRGAPPAERQRRWRSADADGDQ